jgi:hypothetical protein
VVTGVKEPPITTVVAGVEGSPVLSGLAVEVFVVAFKVASRTALHIS